MQMNIDFHYFMIKTLAYTAGFSEEDAQTIAYYSQQVDDFTKSSPMRVRQEPPAYFIEKGYARKLENGLWEVQPHPTGIDVPKSLEEHYRHTTLVPFHFIPAKPLAELEAESGFTRDDYRCVRADDESALLINMIIDDAVEAVRRHKCEQSLMQLGMALHTYADTYAHCGYSGLEGWENSAFIKEAYNQMTGEEEVPSGERLAYWMLPHIGHANSGHVPDVCTYQIDVAMRRDEQDNALTRHIARDNLQEFLNCAKAIWEILRWAARTGAHRKMEWDKLKEKLATGMQILTSDENKEEKLASHWNSVFPEIIYTYDKDLRFYRRGKDTSLRDKDIFHRGENISPGDEGIFSGYEGMHPGDGSISYKDKNVLLRDDDIAVSHHDIWAESAVQDEFEVLGEALGITSVYDVTNAFYMYNELAYRRAELVLGTSKQYPENSAQELCPENGVLEILSGNSAAELLTGNRMPKQLHENAAQELLPGNESALKNGEMVPAAVERCIYNGDWEPRSDLGRVVYAAGFVYLPKEDIICSTMNNVQRLGGYCRGYDDAAIAINSVIDCEPIYFCYDGCEWMIELWKGQYGIETGGEIGVYYREQDKPLSIAEETVLGKLYGCVPDERMLNLRFVLYKNGRPLFERGWERHWWLTGFHWGILSEPEQLTMAVGICFPNRWMQQAFVCQGLEKLGYSYVETGNCSVEFCFAGPMTRQPDAREKLRKSVQAINRENVDAYNSFRRKYGITVNDPNIINQAINRQTGIPEGKLYEKLLRHFNMKAEIKESIQNNI